MSIKKSFRNSGITTFAFANALLNAQTSNYKYFATIITEPRIMKTGDSYGGKVLAEVFYDEPGYPHSLSSEELK
jgi:hypothetical protein